MKRFLYIILLVFVAVVTIVAQNSSHTAVTESTISQQDSVTGDSGVNSSSVSTRRSNRKPFVSPVNNEATRTQYHNDAAGDTARMIERRRKQSIHYHDENGNTVMVDTVTGEEWVDSTAIPPVPKMKQPLMFSIEAGVNLWDPIMRIFGQKYGLIDFSVALNLHNRYLPTVEAGVGTAKKTPSGMNFTYSSPVAPFVKIGADYNFLYNSNPDYRFTAGFRYGVSPFSYSLSNVTFNDSYWGAQDPIAFPRQNVFAGWLELVAGVRVHIAGPISVGWMFRYKMLLHQTHPSTGDAWYIPGMGSVTSPISASISVVYNIPLNKKKHAVFNTEPDEHHLHNDNAGRTQPLRPGDQHNTNY